jgi:FtsP/CotA-like multicopper oxidase with cupredoxin domain
MERFMWSFDGESYSEVTKPIPFRLNERVRITLVNDTMMSHPIHIARAFLRAACGAKGPTSSKAHGECRAGRQSVSVDLTTDAPGDWALPLPHALMHMHAGMFRVMSVRPLTGEGA